MPENSIRLISSLCDIKFSRVTQPYNAVADNRCVAEWLQFAVPGEIRQMKVCR
ncbi:hypothetical protein yaldo0001_8810 [Yersinia aldovae ATCC 35236]|uniref:Uncharacterized protein n=1 Tax=Yersinia aldovae TaxID=29483 RepID=A0A0T9UCI8_YERAL|nr:hypothetical protein AT01_3774 [Yersinia aldovae 670-83]EEP96293.1 hypothetical protein yaldo0001_8810 [Yersinia aldovae ATCC 35236]CNJ19938.1 Uncharacterised protein [Yersinia aldovae]CNL32922.1 Uncharacterised protein [Yersinia aldovae]CNL36652.1 Uncharacterised protein [Yersinia aldovae]